MFQIKKLALWEVITFVMGKNGRQIFYSS